MPTTIPRIATIAAACAAAMVFGGCGGGDEPVRPAQPVWRRPWGDDDVSKPGWIADPTRAGTMIAAYGSTAADPQATHGQLRDRAMQGARDELARMVRVRVANVLKDWLAESGGGYDRFTEAASRQVADQSVEGSYQRDQWTHPKTGEFFIWVVVDPSFAKRIGQTLAESARGASTGDSARDAHLHAKAGSDAGFAELDRLLGKQLATH